MPVRKKFIRSIVTEILNQLNISTPPVPVDQVATDLGIFLQRQPAPDDLSGFIYRENLDNITIIGVNSNHSSRRQRFTIAHEIGHYMLHDIDSVHVDNNLRVKLRNKSSSEGTDIEEMEANLFAAEILMPFNMLEKDISALDYIDIDEGGALNDLATKYDVSLQAMTIRLSYLGYVSL